MRGRAAPPHPGMYRVPPPGKKDDDSNENNIRARTSPFIYKCFCQCEERIYCYSVIFLTNVEIIYSLVLTSLNRKQPVDLLSVDLFVKS